MTFSRRTFLGAAGATAASLALPHGAHAIPGGARAKPAYSLTGGTSTDGALVCSTLRSKDAFEYLDLAVASVPNMAGYTLTGLQRADGDSIVRHLVTGKQPNTTYYAMLVSDGEFVGEQLRFKTQPTGETSWSRKIAVVSCMGNAADHFSTELAWDDLMKWGAEEIWHLGDWGYWGQLIPRNASYKKDLYHYL